jgi:hypothetical protein
VSSPNDRSKRMHRKGAEQRVQERRLRSSEFRSIVQRDRTKYQRKHNNIPKEHFYE